MIDLKSINSLNFLRFILESEKIEKVVVFKRGNLLRAEIHSKNDKLIIIDINIYNDQPFSAENSLPKWMKGMPGLQRPAIYNWGEITDEMEENYSLRRRKEKGEIFIRKQLDEIFNSPE